MQLFSDFILLEKKVEERKRILALRSDVKLSALFRELFVPRSKKMITAAEVQVGL